MWVGVVVGVTCPDLSHRDAVNLEVLQGSQKVRLCHHSLGNLPIWIALEPTKEGHAFADRLHWWRGFGKRPANMKKKKEKKKKKSCQLHVYHH